MEKIKIKPVSAVTEKSSQYLYRNVCRHSGNINITHNIKGMSRNSKKTRSTGGIHKFSKFHVSTNIFNEVKNMLNIKSVAEFYGTQLNRNTAACPFHSEKTPSFRVYPADNSFYCFGCGAGGTVIDFVMKLFPSLTSFEALKKLNADFRLNLPLFEKTTEDQTYSARLKQSLEEAKKSDENKFLENDFHDWETHAFITLTDWFEILRFFDEQININHIEYYGKYLSEIQTKDYVENLVDVMIAYNDDFYSRFNFYITHGGLIEVIERKLRIYNDSCEIWCRRAAGTINKYIGFLKIWKELIFENHTKYFEKYLREVEDMEIAESLYEILTERIAANDFDAQERFQKRYEKWVTAIECKLEK